MADCLPKNISLKIIAFFLVVVGIVSVLPQRSAFAAPLDWLSSDLHASGEIISEPSLTNQRIRGRSWPCLSQWITVSYSATQVRACVFQSKSFQLAYTEECGSSFGCNYTPTMLLRVKGDLQFYRLIGAYSVNGDLFWQTHPDNDRVIFDSSGTFNIFNSALASFEVSYGPNGKEYTVHDMGTSFISDTGNIVDAEDVEISENGEWLVGRLTNLGLFRMRLSDKTLRLFAIDQEANETYNSIAISNDGNFAIVSSPSTKSKIYKIDANCGRSSSIFWGRSSETYLSEGFSNCPNILLTQVAKGAGINYENINVSDTKFAIFNQNDDEISFFEGTGGNQGRWIRLSAPKESTEILDYLALGDSYSSGEGDVGRKQDGSSYYLPGTNDRGGCHVSSRSYPFLLRDYYNIVESKMRSIACSGAQVVTDYMAPTSGYLGQHKELDGKTEADRKAISEGALYNFKPGILPQIEFVKKYQPRVITLTGGGNDIGFANIIDYCANYHWEDILPIISDCGYAQPGSQLRKMLYNSIDTQFEYNKSLITRIKSVSPDSHIVVVGYPSFIKSGSGVCSLALNSGFLSSNERVAINSAIIYMNAMLKRLAFDTSVSFADIENSLEGGRMCEGSSYVTGITQEGYGEVILNRYADELFHPNAAGHQKIAQVIEGSGAFTTNMTPDASDYSPADDAIITLPMRIITNGWQVLGKPLSITAEPYSFVPDSIVNITGFSDPVDLGNFEADGNGGLNVTISASDLSIGNHIIVLEGKTYFDEAIRYYQFIDILEHEPKDEDLKDIEPKTELSGNTLPVSSSKENNQPSNNKEVSLIDGNESGAKNSQSKTIQLNETDGNRMQSSNEITNAPRGYWLIFICVVAMLVVLLIGKAVYVNKYKKYS